MFTQKCFIQENNQLLRLRLEELGYGKSIFFEGDLPYLYTDICREGTLKPFYDEANFDAPILFHTNDSIINCKGNESLFLAIAALRDDSNEHQWFVWDDDDEGDKWKLYDNDSNWSWWIFECHKASAKELIEHFKK